MNELLNTLTRWIVRLVLLMVGVVFFLSLLALVCVLAAVWCARYLWAKMTGQPIKPWVMPMRAGSTWGDMLQRAGGFGTKAAHAPMASENPAPFTPAPGSKRGGILSKVAADVSDVPVREVTER